MVVNKDCNRILKDQVVDKVFERRYYTDTATKEHKMITKHYTMTFPADRNYNRVAVIKVVRSLTGLGLKEAKDLTEKEGAQLIYVRAADTVNPYTNQPVSAKLFLDESIAELRRNGVIVVEAVRAGTLAEVRKLASEALLRDELDMAVALIDIVRKFS